MPIKLKNLPPARALPPSPSKLRWFLFLVILLLVTLMFRIDPLVDKPDGGWLSALGEGFAVWCAFFVIRALVYVGDRGVVNGWNTARDERLGLYLRAGRRAQQVLAVSLFTALRTPDDKQGVAQRAALKANNKGLRSQAGWQPSDDGFFHSRLPVNEGEQPEALLRRGLAQVLEELVPVLSTLPQKRPLALLLEIDSSVHESVVRGLWQQVWSASGIGQPVTLVEGSGLKVVDQWLDQRINDQALLLVIAGQIAPALLADSAEVLVGLLLGNRLTQTTVAPLAFLHRPERQEQPTREGLANATRQALDWVPVEGAAIEQVWIADSGAQQTLTLGLTLNDVSLPADKKAVLHDLEGFLGHTGCAAPWVAIAAAADAITAAPEPHLIFCADKAAHARLWCAVVMPPPLEQLAG